MTARLAFKKVPEGYEQYIGKVCQRGAHGECPGGFGVQVGFVCGGLGAGAIVSTEEGAPCACTCHDEATS